jgi:hypothetical protein
VPVSKKLATLVGSGGTVAFLDTLDGWRLAAFTVLAVAYIASQAYVDRAKVRAEAITAAVNGS